MKKKVCVITGTRADYGILFPVMKAVQASKYLSLYLITTGMHLMAGFGSTIAEIKKDGFKIYGRINITYQKDTGQAMADFVGRAVSGFSKVFKKLNPDIVMLMGDRGEMLAAAVAANYMGIPVAHIHGGEISGHVDGLVRHAISKLAQLHFPATQKARQRLLKLGEEKKRIFVAGAPALDRILNEFLPDKEELIRKYSIDKSNYLGILVQHPVSSDAGQAAAYLKITLKALQKANIQVMVIYPNADAGSRAMIREIEKFKNTSLFKFYKSIPHRDYLGLMGIADLLIGNSSSALIEAPSFKLPAINIGDRQRGRERGANVIDVPASSQLIFRAIQKALFDKRFKKRISRAQNPYGEGQASQRIAKILIKTKFDKRFLHKQITY